MYELYKGFTAWSTQKHGPRVRGARAIYESLGLLCLFRWSLFSCRFCLSFHLDSLFASLGIG